MTEIVNKGDGVLISNEEAKRRVRSIADSSNDSACIIFGAGSSYGYSQDHFYKPPVVKDLFNDNNPTVRQVINLPKNEFIKNNSQDFSRELNNFDNDLEKYLSSLYKRNREDNLFGNFLSYIEDIFFLASQEVITGSNNYKTLINVMWGLHGKKLWSCISFNYDSLLEKSFLIAGRDTTGRSFSSLESYTERNPVVLKMHGGINFRYTIKELNDSQGNYFNHTTHNLFSKMMSDSRNSDNFLEVIDLGSGRPLPQKTDNILNNETKKWEQIMIFDFPLMLIPIHESVAPENLFFKELIDSSTKSIERANLVVSIGYNFGDEAFTNALSKIDLSKKDIILVNSKSEAKNLVNHLGYQRIKKIWPSDKIRVFEGNGFGEFMDAIC